MIPNYAEPKKALTTPTVGGEKTAITSQPLSATTSEQTTSNTVTTIETDFKFIIAIILIAAFIILLGIPLARNQATLFSTVATAMTGIVGTIVGYYFGSDKAQTTAPTSR